MRYCFIINPVAGDTKNLENYGDKIREICERKGYEYEIFVTQGTEHATSIARQCAEKGGDVRVISCGGDGTIAEVLNGLVGYDNVELGCMPCGSGNDFVKCFGERDEFLDIENYIDCESINIDLIKTDDRYCMNISSLGLDAIICDKAVKYIRSGKYAGSKAYDKATKVCIFGKRTNELKITIDDKDTYEGKFLFTLAANGVCYGGGYHSAPMADPSDGVLNFIMIRSVPLIKIPALIKPYKSGEFVNDKRFDKISTIVSGRKMTVESKKPAIINIDGECFTREKVTFEIMDHAMRFIVPRSYIEKKRAAAKN